MADAFDNYVMNPKNGVFHSDGHLYFAMELESNADGGLSTFGAIVLGKILRGDEVSYLLPSLATYFNEEAGIFLDNPHNTSCEYWVLMYVNSLAAAIIRSRLTQDPASIKILQRSADRLIELAHQISYNFNDPGYDFKKDAPLANVEASVGLYKLTGDPLYLQADTYRQPDAVGGYSYLMLFAYEMLGDRKYLGEALAGLRRYQSFSKNPWYEIPSAATACVAAARLSVRYNHPEVDLFKVLSFALDPRSGALVTGEWGGKEVNGLMQGWPRCEVPGAAFTLESMVVLPYILPVLRYSPQYATDIGMYALNIASNLRWFYSEYLPREFQSRPDLTPIVPYEDLSRGSRDHSPYAAGGVRSNRSIYGGAYVLWLGELIRPTQDDYVLQLDLAKSDFLANAYPTYLYYNPWNDEREVTLDVGHGKFMIYDTLEHRNLDEGVEGSVSLRLQPGSARVVVVIPTGRKLRIKNGVLECDGVPIDYHANGNT
jgi:hypothetical protein